MILRRLSLAFCMAAAIGGTMTAGSSSVRDAVAALPACCPAPVITASPALYAFTRGHWRRTTTFEQGELARFALLFRGGSSWTSPSASLRLTTASRRGKVPSGRALYNEPMRRERGHKGYLRFSVTLRLRKGMTGTLLASFELSNRIGGRVSAALSFNVKPVTN
jgi:hypothetical protein